MKMMSSYRLRLKPGHNGIKLLYITIIILLTTASVSTSSIFNPPTGSLPVDINIANPSFEPAESDAWALTDNEDAAEILSDELAAAPDGTSYARILGKGSMQQSLTADGVVVTAGQTYVATVWARSVNPPSESNSLSTKARIDLITTNGQTFSSELTSVEAPLISAVKKNGSSANTIGDDGVNVWFDNGYRMHSAGRFYSQTVSQDPVNDPWTKGGFAGGGMANGPIIVPGGGPKALYDTFYIVDTGPEVISRIEKVDLLGTAPNYNLPDPTGEDEAGEIYDTVLSHTGDQYPWVIDAHLTYDPDEDRLWMAWGGHSLWITEMDVATGNVRGNPSDPEFNTHPANRHKCVAAWEPSEFRTCVGADAAPDGWDGDENGVAYHEGPSLYKKDGFWYYCGSYGSMGYSYTLRCCRSSNPDGPFVDKDGIGCTKFDEGKNRFGASMLLGPEGHQAVPGHPHMWEEEDGTEYLGYDFRNYEDGRGDDNPFRTDDVMGIRQLYWVNGWPTIWTPLTVKFVANDNPDTIGQTLSIKIGSYGNSDSHAAFDLVKAYHYDDEPTTTAPTPSPIEDEPITTAPTPSSDEVERCYNDKKFRLNGKKKRNCKWIGQRKNRRKQQCKKDEVEIGCPSVCGLDCCDDPTFKFKIDSGARKSCNWLKNSVSSEDKYCAKNMIKTQCSETCGFCFD